MTFHISLEVFIQAKLIFAESMPQKIPLKPFKWFSKYHIFNQGKRTGQISHKSSSRILLRYAFLWTI